MWLPELLTDDDGDDNDNDGDDRSAQSSDRVSQRAIDLELELKLELASEAWQLHKLPRGWAAQLNCKGILTWLDLARHDAENFSSIDRDKARTNNLLNGKWQISNGKWQMAIGDQRSAFCCDAKWHLSLEVARSAHVATVFADLAIYRSGIDHGYMQH